MLHGVRDFVFLLVTLQTFLPFSLRVGYDYDLLFLRDWTTELLLRKITLKTAGFE